MGCPSCRQPSHTSRQSCDNAGEARIFTPVRESSRESRIPVRRAWRQATPEPPKARHYKSQPDLITIVRSADTECVAGYPMPTEMTEHRSESRSIDAPATGKPGAALDRDAKSPPTEPASKQVTPGAQRSTRRRRLLLGVLGVLVLAAALWFGIPYILLTLSTVSTDDAFVNGHVTFVAARVHGQVSRVLVDDNYRVHKGDLLVQLDKEPFQDAVAVKKAAVDSAQADLEAAKAQVRGIEAQAWSRRWNLQRAMEDVQNQVSLLRARVAGVEMSRASLKLAELDFERAKQLLPSASIPKQEYDRREATLLVARAQLTQSLADVYQIRVSLGLPVQPEGGGDLGQVPPDLDQTFSSVLKAQADLFQTAA